MVLKADKSHDLSAFYFLIIYQIIELIGIKWIKFKNLGLFKRLDNPNPKKSIFGSSLKVRAAVYNAEEETKPIIQN